MINTAKSYLALDLSVIPVKPETKSPTIASWKPFQTQKMTPNQADDLFSQARAIAVISGSVSGNLIIIDFDNHFGDATDNLTRFEEMISTENMVKQSTPSGGYHLIYRTPRPGKNQKLAQRMNDKGQPDTIIETRGEGGYALISPSQGYSVISGAFDKIPVLSEAEHENLVAIARSFNEYIRPDKIYSHDVFGSDGDRPGDLYNESEDGRMETPALLQNNGWKTTDGKHYTRPGKESGVSATWGKVKAGNVPLFYVFSTNGGVFEDQKSYKPFQVFALLAHGGDFDQASKELRERGFGKPSSNKLVYQAAIKSIHQGIKLKSNNFGELSEELGVPEEQIKQQFEPIYDKRRSEFGFDKMTDIEKAEIFLTNRYEFRRNVVTQKTEMKVIDGDWERLNDNTVYCDFQRSKIKFTFDKIKALLRSNFVSDYDPFIEYFGGLPKWDGYDYVHDLANHVQTDDPDKFAIMLLKHLVRTIKCALEPDYYNRMVFTLVSEQQEIGKSYFIRFLNPFGNQYYSEEFLRDDKDSQFRLSENFMYNLEELDTLSKMDVGKLKAMISKSGVNERVPYEAQKISLPRRCSFFGSTNRGEFLLDDRNTRWLVFQVYDFDRKYSKTINIHDVWSQCWELYKDPDFDCELSREEATWRDDQNKNYQIQEMERTIIIENIEKSTEPGEYMTNVDVMELISEVTQGKLKLTTSSQKIGRIMSELGFVTGQRSIHGKNCRVYYARAIAYMKRKAKLPEEEVPF